MAVVNSIWSVLMIFIGQDYHGIDIKHVQEIIQDPEVQVVEKIITSEEEWMQVVLVIKEVRRISVCRTDSPPVIQLPVVCVGNMDILDPCVVSVHFDDRYDQWQRTVGCVDITSVTAGLLLVMFPWIDGDDTVFYQDAEVGEGREVGGG
jgi:hypothetical protein